ncbi:glucosamine-6-phosphate deaminase [Staphylococcus pasteuri]
MNQILFNQYPYFNRQNIHIPNGDASNLDEEVKRYNQIIESEGPIDVQLLGIGENGHIGFNEPGTDFGSETHVVDLTESTIKANSRYFNHESEVPKQAVSMGLQSIIKAERIILLAFGEKKREAIKNLLNQPISEDIPSTILKTHVNVEIYVDDATAPDVD